MYCSTSGQWAGDNFGAKETNYIPRETINCLLTAEIYHRFEIEYQDRSNPIVMMEIDDDGGLEARTCG